MENYPREGVVLFFLRFCLKKEKISQLIENCFVTL